jgi:hypothetical protein
MTSLSIRILLIEDDNDRVETFTSWLPNDMRIVHAGSAGRALGILKRDRHAYAGILLDHDLRGQIVTKEDFLLSGSNVVTMIIDAIPPARRPDIPILVHSMNPADAPQMVKRLTSAGFSVTRIPMVDLTEPQFLEWLEEVRDCWSDRT